MGWITKRCGICGRGLNVGEMPVYVCNNCSAKYDAYFCPSDARTLHYRCPFCGQPLEPLIQ